MAHKREQEPRQNEPEFELMDTGIFNEDKYFDVFVEYAKNDTDDILIKISVHNRNKEKALLNVFTHGLVS
jgi:hypothetical protein